jgi:16S rRNA processing protein RimM
LDEYFEVGKIVGAHGLNGEIKVYPITHDASNFYNFDEIFIDSRRYKVIALKFVGQYAAFSLEGIDNRDKAEQLKGQFISINRVKAAPLAEGYYYMSDIIGCKVIDKKGYVGMIFDIIETGGNDVYVINCSDGIYAIPELLIPAIDSVIKNIDISARIITVEIPKGLLEDECF